MLSPICNRRTGASLPWFSWQKPPRTAASTCSRLAMPAQNLAIGATPPAQHHEGHSQPDRKRLQMQPPASYAPELEPACSSQRNPLWSVIGHNSQLCVDHGLCGDTRVVPALFGCAVLTVMV